MERMDLIISVREVPSPVSKKWERANGERGERGEREGGEREGGREREGEREREGGGRERGGGGEKKRRYLNTWWKYIVYM